MDTYAAIPRNVRSSGALIAIANPGQVRGKVRLFENDASSDFAAGGLRLVIDDITARHRL